MRVFFQTKQSGLSLVELMVAMVLGLLLIGGVLQIFLSSKNTYTTNLALSKVQESGRFAMDFLTFDIRNASYRGECVGSLNNLPSPLNNDERYILISGIKGWDNSEADSALPSWFPASKRLSGTDMVLLKHAANSAGVTLAFAPTNDTITTTTATKLAFGTLLVIAEPVGCDIFQNQKTATSLSISSSNEFRYAYSQKADLLKYQSSIYYIDNGSNNTPSLWRVRYDNPSDIVTEEIVEGIQNMQIKYAQGDSKGNITGDYLDANNITDWSSVVSVKITLLATSNDTNVVSPNQVVRFNGQDITINNGRLAQVFSITVGIRNRLP